MKRFTIREAAAVLALILLAACGGGGGGALSPFAPGVSGAPATAAPVVTLAVMPAAPFMPTVGSTATVVATISSAAAGVPVTYAGGCESVATVTPTTQSTLPGGSTAAYTLTATVASAACTARFVAGAADAITSPHVGTATPIPTPFPSPLPTLIPTSAPTAAPTLTPATPTPAPVPTLPPGPLMVSPVSLLIGNTNPTSATFTASEANYAGAFSETDTCAAIATIVQAPAGTFAASQVPLSGGACIATVHDDHAGSVPVTITATSAGVIIFSHAR
jgi:hypothetical protein